MTPAAVYFMQSPRKMAVALLEATRRRVCWVLVDPALPRGWKPVRERLVAMDQTLCEGLFA
jgi:hypothetical protein